MRRWQGVYRCKYWHYWFLSINNTIIFELSNIIPYLNFKVYQDNENVKCYRCKRTVGKLLLRISPFTFLNIKNNLSAKRKCFGDLHKGERNNPFTETKPQHCSFGASGIRLRVWLCGSVPFWCALHNSQFLYSFAIDDPCKPCIYALNCQLYCRCVSVQIDVVSPGTREKAKIAKFT